jgi:UDP-glucose 4-epimerase
LPASTGFNNKARAELGWPPRHDVRTLIGRLNADDDFRSPLARAIGRNRHHDRGCEDGPNRSHETGPGV